MTDRSSTKLALWPFLLVDILFVGLAWLILSYAHRPLQFWEALALFGCVAAGAWSFLTPFLRRYAAEVKIVESDNLTNTVTQIKNLDQIAAQLSSATNHLKTAQDESRQAVASAKGIAEKMTEESRAFAEFIQKANDSEKGHLRLEVDKLRRAEVDWIQILVHMLDHVFALNQAAVRSGKPAVMNQIENFQNVCRETARRIGLVCHSEGNGAFDEKLHQLSDDAKAENGAQLGGILAPGYSYQGRMVRRSLVHLKSAAIAENLPGTGNEIAGSTIGVEPLEASAQKSLF